MTDYIPRVLSYHDTEGQLQRVSDREISAATAPVVILGEPGMGKTWLLEYLATRPSHTLITAKALLRRPLARPLCPEGEILVIDALDEVASAKEEDPVHQVLGRLAASDAPPFILSCRAADWRGAIARHDITEDYGVAPIELHLEPLSRQDAVIYLARQVPLDRAEQIIETLSGRSLDPLYGNPLTLTLLATLAGQAGTLPDTRAKLFEAACDLLWREQNPLHARLPLSSLSAERALDGAGAACAALILTGSEAVSLETPGQVIEGDLPLGEVAALPAAGDLPVVLASTLFRRLPGGDRLAPLHRAIAEYLGARWLAARHPQTGSRRLSALFAHGGGVPASLRGLHAWLAHFSRALAPEVIDADPYGVLRYGDADRLSPSEARRLLAALKRLSTLDPYFRSEDWTRHAASGLAQLALADDLRSLVSDRETGLQLRVLVLEALNGTPVAETLRTFLHDILMRTGDGAFSYAEREAAGEALLALPSFQAAWPRMIETLLRRAGEDDRRLAVELLTYGDPARFTDQLIVRALLAYLGLLPGNATASAVDTIGPTILLVRRIPGSRIGTILDALVTYSPATKRLGWEVAYALNDVLTTLVAAQLAYEPPAPLRLLSWLRLRPRREGRSGEAPEAITAFLKENLTARRAIQRQVLLDSGGGDGPWGRSWQLHEMEPILYPTAEDVAALLTDPRFAKLKDSPVRVAWKELVRITVGRDGLPQSVLTPAHIQAAGDAELEAYLAELSTPRVLEWEVKQQRKEAALARAKAKRSATHRADFVAHLEEVRSGELGWILPLAQAYFGRFSDMASDTAPRTRIADWLGEEVLTAALAGFEAVLHRQDLPSAVQVAESYAASKRWNFILPLLAGLCERAAAGTGFGAVADDVLLAGRLGAMHEHLREGHGGDVLQTALDAWLDARPAQLEHFARLLVESQLRHNGTTYVNGLYQLARRPDLSGTLTSLASEWLAAFPSMPAEAEAELVDQLLRASRWELLRGFISVRAHWGYRDLDHRLTWLAIAFVVDFAANRPALDVAAADHPNLLWHIRSRGGGRWAQAELPELGRERLVWIVRRFRAVFPVRGHPTGSWGGDRNPWDASDFVQGAINRIAADVTEEGLAALAALRDEVQDSYSPHILYARAQQLKARREAGFAPLSLPALAAVTASARPRTVQDLKALFLEQLEVLQRKLWGEDVDRIALFHGPDGPLDENTCRDRLTIQMRDGLPFGIELTPERRMPQDRRADLTLLLDGLQLPVEAKGQWNRGLWTAAQDQLDAAYAIEWRASGVGVYLVFWFGNTVQARRLQAPPRPGARPTTPEELTLALKNQIPEHRRGDLAVFVLDVSRETPPKAANTCR